MAAKLNPKAVEFLNGVNFGHVATINADGTPHVSPVWVEYDGTHVIVNSEEKRVKVKNAKRNPNVSISIQDAANAYRYVEIRGKVVEITREGAFEGIDRLAKKYMGQDKYPYNKPDDQRVIMKIDPTRVSMPMA